MFQKLIERCESGELLTQEEAILVLHKGLQSGELARVYAEADRRARAYCNNRGRIGVSIGIDAAPCTRSCKFCSHGAAWGAYAEPFEYTIEEVLGIVRSVIPLKPNGFTLRTTQDYSIEKLCNMVREVKKLLPPEINVGVNTGELNLDEALKIKKAGASGAYHAIRLREGCDTGISIEDRIKTLVALEKAGLAKSAAVEPLGPEHTDEEIVEAAFRTKPYHLQGGCVMARVPVPKTPLYELGQVSKERHMRVLAMTRLIYGPETKRVACHPPFSEALKAGASAVTVEYGAIPRDQGTADTHWRGFSIHDARKLLTDQGFDNLEVFDNPV